MATKLHKLLTDLNPIFIGTHLPSESTIDLMQHQNEFKSCDYSLCEDVFVYARMLPPGLNSFNIRTKKKCQEHFKETEGYKLNFEVPSRQKDLNVFYKKKKKMRVNRFF